MDTFLVLKVLAQWAMPPASMAVGLVIAGMVALLRWRRLAWVTAVAAVLETLAFAWPPVSDALIQPLEREARANASVPACCYDAIVVLGGGINPAAPPHTLEPDLGDGADRMWYAAQLFHRGVAPRIIVSGGGFLAGNNGGPATTEAEAMRRFLNDLGVPDRAIVSEDRSLNTIQNIERVREMVKDKRVALVTSAFHMRRAMRIAQRAGLDAAPFPTDFHAPAAARPWWENWAPNAAALGWSAVALREYLALLFDRRGRE
ncbi:MAG: YdcF family protein [Reyranellaceae bacterium]